VELTGPLGRIAHGACASAIGQYRPQWTTGPVPLGYHRPGVVTANTGDRTGEHARPNRRTRATEPANTRDRTGEHARPNRRTRRFGQWYG
jgi:hypothetical protein